MGNSSDLLVIGAGPAGCAAAIMAAHVGLKVTVLEAAESGGPEPGETLHPGVEPIFEQLGVLRAVAQAGFHRHEGIWRENGTEKERVPYGRDAAGPWRGFQVDRRKLGHILRSAAISLGARIKPGVRASELLTSNRRVAGVVADGYEYRARWTCDATGRRAWLSRKLGLQQRICSEPKFVTFGWTQHSSNSAVGDPVFRQLADGWQWIAPIENGRSAWVRLRSRPEGAADPQMGIDMTWRLIPACASDGYFLLGDAATIVDPSSSHGVLKALLSGILSAHLCAQMTFRDLPATVASEEYRNWVNRQFFNTTRQLSHLWGRG